MNMLVKCPTCRKDVEWSATSKFRPFCCKRCRLIDLGEWASENHSIPDESVSSIEEFLPLTNENPDKI